MGAPEWDTLRELDEDGPFLMRHLWSEGRMEDDVLERRSLQVRRSPSSPFPRLAVPIVLLAAVALFVSFALRRLPSPEVVSPLGPLFLEGGSLEEGSLEGGSSAPSLEESTAPEALVPSPPFVSSPTAGEEPVPRAATPSSVRAESTSNEEEELSDEDPFGLLALADHPLSSEDSLSEESSQGEVSEGPGEPEEEEQKLEEKDLFQGAFEGIEEVSALLRETQDTVQNLEAQSETTMRTCAIRDMTKHLEKKMLSRSPLSKLDGGKALTGSFALYVAALLASHAHRPFTDDALRILKSLAYGRLPVDNLLLVRYSESDVVDWVDDVDKYASALPRESAALADMRTEMEAKQTERDKIDLMQRRSENSELLESVEVVFYRDSSVSGSLNYLQNDLQRKLSGIQGALDDVKAAAQRLTSRFKGEVHVDVLKFIKQIELVAETQLRAEAGRLAVLSDLANGTLLVRQSQRKAERQLPVQAFAAFDSMSSGPISVVLPTPVLEVLEPANPLLVEDDFNIQLERLRRWAATFSQLRRKEGLEFDRIAEQVTKFAGKLLSRPFDETLVMLDPDERDTVLSVNEAIVGKEKINAKDLSRALSHVRDRHVLEFVGVPDWFEEKKEEHDSAEREAATTRQPMVRKYERVRRKK